MPVVMVTNRARVMGTRAAACRRAMGFTLIDLLVSIAIIGVLIALILPSMSGVREATRRVVCASNVRQLGYGIAMYRDDHQDQMPPSQFTPKPEANNTSTATNPQYTLYARTGTAAGVLIPDVWDGLGLLFNEDYISAPQVYYCPSHRGSHPYASYADTWHAESGEIFTNFQYRGTASVLTDRSAILCDGLATVDDFSHKIGLNVVRADYSVSWVPDLSRRIVGHLPESASEPESLASGKVRDAWDALDGPAGP